MKLTSEQSCNILYGDDESYEIVLDEITDTTRWSVLHDIVIKRKSDGAFFLSYYSVGATEYQNESPWQDEDEVEWKEVTPKTKEVIVYE